MSLELREESMALLDTHAAIPVAFRVDRILFVVPDGAHRKRWVLREEGIDRPYVKDYDRVRGNAPKDWPTRFDVSSWTLLSAHIDGRRVGGAIVVPAATEPSLGAHGSQLGLLWDLRVQPEARRSGIATALFANAERLAAERGWSGLRVETQNINVAACRFYERHGCELESVDEYACTQTCRRRYN